MLQVVVHRVAQPRNGRPQSALGLFDVKQAFFECKRSDVVAAATFRMSERFVDEVDGNVSGTEVPMYRLQTGDVSDEGGSGQAPEDKDDIFSFDAAE